MTGPALVDLPDESGMTLSEWLGEGLDASGKVFKRMVWLAEKYLALDSGQILGKEIADLGEDLDPDHLRLVRHRQCWFIYAVCPERNENVALAWGNPYRKPRAYAKALSRYRDYIEKN